MGKSYSQSRDVLDESFQTNLVSSHLARATWGPRLLKGAVTLTSISNSRHGPTQNVGGNTVDRSIDRSRERARDRFPVGEEERGGERALPQRSLPQLFEVRG